MLYRSVALMLTLLIPYGDAMAKKDSLTKYRAKRNLEKTPEPKGGKPKSKKPIFVIQKHDASHMHFDFRIAVDGVLKSWAVPKGPSLNPRIKRLAAFTEDHPYDYAQFEGTIPAGNYGAGTVMIWDYGTYENIKKKDGKLVPIQQCLKNGTVEITLHGQRLNGNFALVQMHASDNWLLIKMKDAYASARANPASTEKTSAKTGRTMSGIAKNEGGDNEEDPTTLKLRRTSHKSTGKSSKFKKKSTNETTDTLKVGKYTLKLTNQDKLLFARPAITKGELVQYYQEIAPIMLPYLKNRPISMQRFPEGIGHEGFFQKDAADYFPDYIQTKKIKKENGITDYVVVNNTATLVYLANLACITIHPWLSTTKKLDYPDRIIFDLDPSGKDFNKVRFAALQLKKLLESIGLQSYPMITGSRGIHVWVPIKPEYSYDAIKKFTHDIAQKLVDQDPENLTLEMRKDKRGDKIFVDYLRNAFGATGVAPYSVRPRAGAPVATPLTWQEVAKTTLKPDQWTIHTVAKRIQQKGDVWQGIEKKKQSIKKAIIILKSL